MAQFLNGSPLQMPLKTDSNQPLNAKEVANSVAQVLSDLPMAERYVGMAIFCELENKVYRFTKHDDGNGGLTSGIEDSDFRVDTMSVNTDVLIEIVSALPTPNADNLGKYVLLSTDNKIYKCMLDIDGVTYKWVDITKKGIEIVDNYSLLPTVTEDTICYVVNDYIDTTVIPNITHKKGFYLWHDDTINPPVWTLISSSDNEIPEWETGHDYVIGDLVQESGSVYECIVNHTSSVFANELDNWINKVNVYSLTKAQYDYMITLGLINDNTKDLFIITDDTGSSDNVDINKQVEENYIKTVTINDIDEDITCERIIETIGSEKKEILIAKTPSSDGTTIKADDIISITKTMGSVTIFEYYILDDNTIDDPFA